MHRRVSLKLTELNSYLTCHLCKGYLIDAATITECLHSFCKSCIVRYIRKKEACPICKLEIIRDKIYMFLKKDSNLQYIVYKLVPGLFKSEMERRRTFYATHPKALKYKNTKKFSLLDKEAIGELNEDFINIQKNETMSISIEYSETGLAEIFESQRLVELNPSIPKIYLECPATLPVRLLKKFLCIKLNRDSESVFEIMYDDKPLKNELTLIDIAYIFAWIPRVAPMRLFYRFAKLETTNENKPVSVTSSTSPNETTTTVTTTTNCTANNSNNNNNNIVNNIKSNTLQEINNQLPNKIEKIEPSPSQLQQQQQQPLNQQQQNHIGSQPKLQNECKLATINGEQLNDGNTRMKGISDQNVAVKFKVESDLIHEHQENQHQQVQQQQQVMQQPLQQIQPQLNKPLLQANNNKTNEVKVKLENTTNEQIMQQQQQQQQSQKQIENTNVKNNNVGGKKIAPKEPKINQQIQQQQQQQQQNGITKPIVQQQIAPQTQLQQQTIAPNPQTNKTVNGSNQTKPQTVHDVLLKQQQLQQQQQQQQQRQQQYIPLNYTNNPTTNFIKSEKCFIPNETTSRQQQQQQPQVQQAQQLTQQQQQQINAVLQSKVTAAVAAAAAAHNYFPYQLQANLANCMPFVSLMYTQQQMNALAAAKLAANSNTNNTNPLCNNNINPITTNNNNNQLKYPTASTPFDSQFTYNYPNFNLNSYNDTNHLNYHHNHLINPLHHQLNANHEHNLMHHNNTNNTSNNMNSDLSSLKETQLRITESFNLVND